MSDLISPFPCLLFGITLGALLFFLLQRYKIGSYQKLAEEIIRKSEADAEKIRNAAEIKAKEAILDRQKDVEKSLQQERAELQKEATRLSLKEDKLESRMNLVEKKLTQVEKREAVIMARKEEIDNARAKIRQDENTLRNQLETASGLTSAEAKEMLFSLLKEEIQTEAANLIRKITKEAEEEGERQASRILATAINRLAVPCVSEVTVNTVSLPNEEMKGRIIGREGRNIRTLERLTGINFVIDDTPNAVVLSGYDPVRLYVAKTTLIDLVSDGRIHPTRIEDAVEKATLNVDKKVKEYGEDAALRIGALNMHPELIKLLGKLKFRYSFGQNVLDHSIEVSHLMGLMAAELNLDVDLAKRIGLLHDIGKAAPHEIKGTHALIGRDLALKFGESEAVANGIGCHHNEIEPSTVEGSLCGAADAISASRPGARTEALEEYVKRINRLENIAYEFPGIEKAYALQAGRELCIIVLPDMIDDSGVINLARDITKRIEQELHYNGKIKITVIREKKVVEYAV